MANQFIFGQEHYAKVVPPKVDDSEKQLYHINFTITFNPHKFSDLDTLWDAPMYFARYINRVRFFHKLWFVFENHKNGRKHLHGQITIKVPKRSSTLRFDFNTNVSKWCNARLGRSDFYWNNATIRDGDYPTWEAYCFKENPKHTYHIYQDDNQIYTKDRV